MPVSETSYTDSATLGPSPSEPSRQVTSTPGLASRRGVSRRSFSGICGAPTLLSPFSSATTARQTSQAFAIVFDRSAFLRVDPAGASRGGHFLYDPLGMAAFCSMLLVALFWLLAAPPSNFSPPTTTTMIKPKAIAYWTGSAPLWRCNRLHSQIRSSFMHFSSCKTESPDARLMNVDQ